MSDEHGRSPGEVGLAHTDDEARSAMAWLVAEGWVCEEFSDARIDYVTAQVEASIWPNQDGAA